MNRNKLVMAVIGGTGVAIALVAALVVFMKSSDLEAMRDNIRNNSQACESKRGITRATGMAMDKERKALEAAALEAYYSLTNGAVVGEVPERTALQKRMHAACDRYKKLPSDSSRKIIADDFSFGPFGEYIKGTIPSEKETAVLARRWSDVSEMTDMLVQVRATQLLDVKVLTKKSDESAADARQNRNRYARGRNSAKEPVSKYACSEETYELTFLARPAAFVGFMNAVADSRRFIVVDSVRFFQDGDPLLKMIGADAKEDARKKKENLEVQQDDSLNKVCVTDPATTEPFTVTVKVTTMIFAENKEAK